MTIKQYITIATMSSLLIHECAKARHLLNPLSRFLLCNVNWSNQLIQRGYDFHFAGTLSYLQSFMVLILPSPITSYQWKVERAHRGAQSLGRTFLSGRRESARVPATGKSFRVWVPWTGQRIADVRWRATVEEKEKMERGWDMIAGMTLQDRDGQEQETESIHWIHELPFK